MMIHEYLCRVVRIVTTKREITMFEKLLIALRLKKKPEPKPRPAVSGAATAPKLHSPTVRNQQPSPEANEVLMYSSLNSTNTRASECSAPREPEPFRGGGGEAGGAGASANSSSSSSCSGD